jgi:hypothetical protein
MIYFEAQWRLFLHVLLSGDLHKFVYAIVFVTLVLFGAATRSPRAVFGREWPLAYLIWPTVAISAMYLYAGAVEYFLPFGSARRAGLGWPVDVLFVGIIAFCLAFVMIKSLRIGRVVASVCTVLYIWIGFFAWLICATAVTGGRI